MVIAMRGNKVFLEAKHLTKIFTVGTFLRRSKLVAVDDVLSAYLRENH